MAGINPAALSIEQLVAILNKSGGSITQANVEADLAAGAPRNADGTIHLVHYAAWLASMSD